MSKERDLLKCALEHFEAYGITGSFIDVVEELLAQPEQEPVPMAWMWTRNYEGGGYTNMVFQMKCEVDEYEKDSESLKRPDLVRPLYLGVEND